MDDLVKRLRDEAWEHSSVQGDELSYTSQLLNSAADALEAKDKEIERLKAERKRMINILVSATDPFDMPDEDARWMGDLVREGEKSDE